MSKGGLEAKAFVSIILFLIVSATLAPKRTAPKNSVKIAMKQACLRVRLFAATAVANYYIKYICVLYSYKEVCV